MIQCILEGLKKYISNIPCNYAYFLPIPYILLNFIPLFRLPTGFNFGIPLAKIPANGWPFAPRLTDELLVELAFCILVIPPGVLDGVLLTTLPKMGIWNMLNYCVITYQLITIIYLWIAKTVNLFSIFYILQGYIYIYGYCTKLVNFDVVDS